MVPARCPPHSAKSRSAGPALRLSRRSPLQLHRGDHPETWSPVGEREQDNTLTLTADLSIIRLFED
jgi:hypothetical protein